VAARRSGPGPGSRERVLSAALELFAQRGFDGASTHEIARRAAVNQGLIAHHFGTKEALWRELVRSGLAQLCARLPADEAGGGSGVTPVATLIVALGAHRSLVQLLLHALLEPGARRSWLLHELAPVQQRVRSWLERGVPRRRDDAFLLIWSAAAAALPCFGGALELGSDLEAIARLQRDALEQWWLGGPLLSPAGPWSLPAAARRRLMG
jgi:AcrR family transcriptional regulator